MVNFWKSDIEIKELQLIHDIVGLKLKTESIFSKLLKDPIDVKDEQPSHLKIGLKFVEEFDLIDVIGNIPKSFKELQFVHWIEGEKVTPELIAVMKNKLSKLSKWEMSLLLYISEGEKTKDPTEVIDDKYGKYAIDESVELEIQFSHVKMGENAKEDEK